MDANSKLHKDQRTVSKRGDEPFCEMSARSVLELGVRNNLQGVVINPAGEWVELGAKEIKTILASAQ